MIHASNLTDKYQRQNNNYTACLYSSFDNSLMADKILSRSNQPDIFKTLQIHTL